MKGTYILLMHLRKNSRIKIGKLGNINFLKGYYCYVGSAFGEAVNLENRIDRHKRLNKEKKGKLRWHVDYFLTNPNASIIETIILKDKKIECRISKLIEKQAKTVMGFGSSDCNCKGHFHYFVNRKILDKAISKIKL